jgi:chlorinating enzyme
MGDELSSLSINQVNQFEKDGFLVVRNLFSEDEIQSIRVAVKSDKIFDPHKDHRKFSNTGNAQLVVWNKANESVWGSIACSERVVNTIEKLLGFEVYHYHSKLSIKHPGSGGKWCWHQDYGYWYDYGCLFPDLGSVMIALDENNKENGCLKVVSGSHKLGRLDHKPLEEFTSQVMPLDDPRQKVPSVKSPYKQSGADPSRIASLLKFLDVTYVELQPGDAIFFHCNLLHSSEENQSKDSHRWSLISCYNSIHNSPDRSIARSMDHETFTPLKKVSDARLKKILELI